MFVANIYVYKSKKYCNPSYMQEWKVLISIYPNFWGYALSKIQISEIHLILLGYC